MRVFNATDRGIVRESNQDAAASGIFPDGAAWAVVCDGMGGANGGEFASSCAVGIIEDALKAGYTSGISGSRVRSLLTDAIARANDAVYCESRRNASLRGMGTTVVASIVCGGCVYTAHAGDSRAYKLSSGRLIQLTIDHSVVQEMVDDGRLTPEQAKNHPRKHVITRALGVYDYVELDYSESDFDKDDMIILCSDGLSNCVDNEDIISLAELCRTEQLPSALTEAACLGGGSDNITAVIVCE